MCILSYMGFVIKGVGSSSQGFTNDFLIQRIRCRAKKQHLQLVSRLFPENQGHNLALTGVSVPSSLDIE